MVGVARLAGGGRCRCLVVLRGRSGFNRDAVAVSSLSSWGPLGVLDWYEPNVYGTRRSRLKPLLPPAQRLCGGRSMLMQRIDRQAPIRNRGLPFGHVRLIPRRRLAAS